VDEARQKLKDALLKEDLDEIKAAVIEAEVHNTESGILSKEIEFAKKKEAQLQETSKSS